MTENTANQTNLNSTLCYLLGFITGIFFLLTQKEDKTVKFHALQSTIASLAVFVLNVVLGAVGLYALTSLLSLAMILVFVYVMVKAYRGEKFVIPVIGEQAEKMVDTFKL